MKEHKVCVFTQERKKYFRFKLHLERAKAQYSLGLALAFSFGMSYKL